MLAFVLLQATFFVVGTWLALGLATGVYDGRYLAAIPLLLIHFTVFYSFSAMLAVWTRSTVVCACGGIGFWLVCWGMNFGRHSVVAHEIPGLTAKSSVLMDAGYWVMPKPADLNMVLDDALQSDGIAATAEEFRKVREKGQFHPELSVLASLLFAAVLLAGSAYELQKMDY